MTNSEVKKKMLTKGRVEEICKATGASETEVKSVLTSALPLLLGSTGSTNNNNSGLSLLTGLLSSQEAQPVQQSGGLTLIQDQPQNNSGAGLNILSALLGGNQNQNQSNAAGSLLTGLLGASGTSQAAAEEQVSQETGVGKNKVSLIMLAAIPILIKMLKGNTSSSSPSGSHNTNSNSNQGGGLGDILMSLLK